VEPAPDFDSDVVGLDSDLADELDPVLDELGEPDEPDELDPASLPFEDEELAVDEPRLSVL
jgi:hypothetical protein